jgi:MscS family membrane protein
MRKIFDFHRLNGMLQLALALLATLLVAASARAEAPSDAESAAAPQAQPATTPEAEIDPGSPRAAILGFLEAGRAGDWKRAASFMNLAPVPPNERATRGPELARELKLVLDRTLWVEVDLVSAKPAGDLADGLPPGRERIGSIDTSDGPRDILLERVSRPDGTKTWLISAATVASIPALYDEFGYGALGDSLPTVFFEPIAFEIQLWQWIGLAVIAVLAWFLSWFAARAITGVVRPAIARSATDLDDRLLDAVVGPLRWTLALLAFSVTNFTLGLSVPAQHALVEIETVAGIVAATWFALRLIDVLGYAIEGRLIERDQRSAVSLIPLGRKTLKTFVTVVAGLAALDSFGFDVTALIAGLGIGGLAVALALQKTLENLFGGATLIADRPVRVGDFCRFGDKIGTVEEIGMRSTRVRTLDRTLVSVPNSEFATMQLENFAVRDKIRYAPRLGLRYETTPEQLRYVLVEIRRMLYAHPKVDPDPARIRFVQFGAFSLDLDIFSYVLATDYSEFLGIAEDLNLRIMDIIEEAGTGFAFPSSTTYLAQDGGLDSEKGRSAEAQVAGWREKGSLCLPGFPDGAIRELDDSLPWPPEGSALAHTDETTRSG